MWDDFASAYMPTQSMDLRKMYGMQPLSFDGQPQGSGWSLLDTFDKNTGVRTGQGVAGPAINAASSLFNAYMGMKQYGLAKDQFAESKKQFGMNFDAQRRTTNASLAGRHRALLSADPTNANGYQSMADYMAQYGIPGG